MSATFSGKTCLAFSEKTATLVTKAAAPRSTASMLGGLTTATSETLETTA